MINCCLLRINYDVSNMRCGKLILDKMTAVRGKAWKRGKRVFFRMNFEWVKERLLDTGGRRTHALSVWRSGAPPLWTRSHRE